MSGPREGLRWLGTLLLCASGCWTTQAQLKPSRPPEEFVLPPDDPRFSDYMTYPKEVMNADRIKQERKQDQLDVPGGPGGLSGTNPRQGLSVGGR
ncbi:MAG: hypothetical protein JOY71_23295 [Acetobacteraceae bacterium]|nr:hypothetical protein [Acetobacteraceae bacterium]